MTSILNTPAIPVLIALFAFFIVYMFYARTIDRRVWRPDPKRPTPAVMYMDGVEYFPVNRYVLYGFQFKSVAALGPIVGPALAVQYWGWLPAILWIVLGVSFIGWAQDYSALITSVRMDGRSFGPITYQLLGSRARGILLAYLFMYLMLITAAFIYVLASIANSFPGSFTTLVGLMLTGYITGLLVFRFRWNIFAATGVALVLTALSYVAGFYLKYPSNFLGPYLTLIVWAVIILVLIAIAAIVPVPTLILPFNYITFYPAIASVVLIIIAALLSPVTGVTISQPMFIGFISRYTQFPLWPLLFVTIACGAISGWHSLVSSGTTSKQLEREIDALPVGGGAMFTESLVATASFAATAVLVTTGLTAGAAAVVQGATKLTAALIGQWAAGALALFFGVFLMIMGFTVQQLIFRYWRLALADIVSERKDWLRILGNKYVATIILIAITLGWVATFTFDYIWEYFGGTNQLFAAFALLLVAVYLVYAKSPRRHTLYTLIPGLFMAVTTISALVYMAYVFLRHALHPIKPIPGTYQVLFYNYLESLHITPYPIVSTFDVIAFIIGISLAILSIIMTYYLLRSYVKYGREVSVAKM